MTQNNTETYERVTASILSLIERDELLPWQKSWKGTSEFARSMSSRKLYNGINRWILTLTAQANNWSPWFGTFNQIKALGGQVRKGEKGSMVILWKPMEKVNAEGEVEKFLMLRTFNVFSASQADNLPEKFYNKPEPTDMVGDEDAESTLKGYLERETLNMRHGGDRAFYSPVQDFIQMPHFASFESPEHYYSTAFHEAAHSTGHQSRLNRPEIQNFHHFGDENYSREELVAELGSALVIGVLGLDKPNVVENQAAYLKHWKEALVKDPQALVWAAGRAEKAANRILGVAPATEAPEAQS